MYSSESRMNPLLPSKDVLDLITAITNAVLACIPVQRMDMGKPDDSKTTTIFT